MADNYPERDAGRKLLSQNLRRLRHKRGLSQEALSHLCDVDRTHIARIETKSINFTVDILFSLANGLDVDPRELLLPLDEWSPSERQHESE